jgi:hypothetical protein
MSAGNRFTAIDRAKTERADAILLDLGALERRQPEILRRSPCWCRRRGRAAPASLSDWHNGLCPNRLRPIPRLETA